MDFNFFFFLSKFLMGGGLTRKICAMICLHDRSEIIARMQNFFSCHLPVGGVDDFSTHLILVSTFKIKLMFDVDYRLLS